MLACNDVARLVVELRDRDVLTVCLSATAHDPAQRQAWRLRLEQLLDDVATGIDAAARDGFGAARALLHRELESVTGFLPGPGWLAMVTAERIWCSGPVPAPMPDVVRWRRGPLIGPSLRALKQQRPVVLALVDSRRARIFRYEAGTLEEVADLRADGWIDDLTDRTSSKRATTHSGTRGETGADAADRILQREMSSMLSEVAPVVREQAGEDGYVLLAGPQEARLALRATMAALPAERLADDVALPLTATLAEAKVVVERHASLLTERRQSELLTAVLDDARAGGRGSVGLEQTSRAVERGQVERLLIEPRYAQDHENAVEPVLARCIELGGVVEALAGEPAQRLGGDGMAARLRFVA